MPTLNQNLYIYRRHHQLAYRLDGRRNRWDLDSCILAENDLLVVCSSVSKRSSQRGIICANRHKD